MTEWASVIKLARQANWLQAPDKRSSQPSGMEDCAGCFQLALLLSPAKSKQYRSICFDDEWNVLDLTVRMKGWRDGWIERGQIQISPQMNLLLSDKEGIGSDRIQLNWIVWDEWANWVKLNWTDWLSRVESVTSLIGFSCDCKRYLYNNNNNEVEWRKRNRVELSWR